jgi:hypothetical protein
VCVRARALCVFVCVRALFDLIEVCLTNNALKGILK